MIESLVTGFVLTLARVGTFVQLLPLLGGANVPRTVKVGLSLALSVLICTNEGVVLPASGSSSWLGFGLALGREMILGGMLGFAMSLFLLPAHIAAEFITQEAGFSLRERYHRNGEWVG